MQTKTKFQKGRANARRLVEDLKKDAKAFDGRTIKEVADEYEIGICAARNWLVIYGVDYKRERTIKPSAKNAYKRARDYVASHRKEVENTSNSELARLLGVSNSTIGRVKNEFKIETPYFRPDAKAYPFVQELEIDPEGMKRELFGENGYINWNALKPWSERLGVTTYWLATLAYNKLGKPTKDALKKDVPETSMTVLREEQQDEWEFRTFFESPLERDDEYFDVIMKNGALGISLAGDYWKRYREIAVKKWREGDKSVDLTRRRGRRRVEEDEDYKRFDLHGYY